MDLFRLETGAARGHIRLLIFALRDRLEYLDLIRLETGAPRGLACFLVLALRIRIEY